MSLHCQRWRYRRGTPGRLVEIPVRAWNTIAVAVWPPVVATVLEDVDLLRGQVLVLGLDVVAFVLRHPDLLRRRMHRDADGIPQPRGEYATVRPVRVVAHDGRAIGGSLDAH